MFPSCMYIKIHHYFIFKYSNVIVTFAFPNFFAEKFLANFKAENTFSWKVKNYVSFGLAKLHLFYYLQTYKEASNENISNSSTHIIPIQIEGSPPVNQQNQRSTSQRWSNTSGEDFDQSVRSHENIR